MRSSKRRIFLGFKSILAFTLSLGAAQGLLAQTNKTPPFETIYKLLRENVAGVTSDELNAAAVHGILGQLDGRASMVSSATSAAANKTNLLSAPSVFDKSYAYFRISNVESGLNEKIAEAFKQLAATNKLKGVILDLRFAEGTDYAAAGKTADLFISTEQPLIHWGEGSVSGIAKTNAISVPAAILVNSRTRGAAEALAAALRETKVGLLIGGKSAGQASVFKEFPVGDGQILRIASSPVKVGQNKTLDVNGLVPDIQLDVSLENERAFLQDPYRVITRPIEQVALTLNTNEVANVETNRPRARLNEAELVRRKREGLSNDEEYVEPSIATSPEIRVIRDPALARALDLLKGLAVIQTQRGI